ncbi:MAG: molybdenum cofactor biosynthesis protein MoaE [Deltaproteobacteria bacterium]|nr:molybdenum cofactor biosynthesis protein MoaE [Deltaproteobacteria bacterium]
MNLEALHERIRSSTDFSRVGMIASHRGVVRGTSRDGLPVASFHVKMNTERLSDIIESARKRPGIVEVLVEYQEGELLPGEDVLLVAVAGDLRDNVFPALVDTVDEIKRFATESWERYA